MWKNSDYALGAGLIFYFTFYIFGVGMRTYPTHPPAYGPAGCIITKDDSISHDTLYITA